MSHSHARKKSAGAVWRVAADDDSSDSGEEEAAVMHKTRAKQSSISIADTARLRAEARKSRQSRPGKHRKGSSAATVRIF